MACGASRGVMDIELEMTAQPGMDNRAYSGGGEPARAAGGEPEGARREGRSTPSPPPPRLHGPAAPDRAPRPAAGGGRSVCCHEVVPLVTWLLAAAAFMVTFHAPAAAPPLPGYPVTGHLMDWDQSPPPLVWWPHGPVIILFLWGWLLMRKTAFLITHAYLLSRQEQAASHRIRKERIKQKLKGKPHSQPRSINNNDPPVNPSHEPHRGHGVRHERPCHHGEYAHAVDLRDEQDENVVRTLDEPRDSHSQRKRSAREKRRRKRHDRNRSDNARKKRASGTLHCEDGTGSHRADSLEKAGRDSRSRGRHKRREGSRSPVKRGSFTLPHPHPQGRRTSPTAADDDDDTYEAGSRGGSGGQPAGGRVSRRESLGVRAEVHVRRGDSALQPYYIGQLVFGEDYSRAMQGLPSHHVEASRALTLPTSAKDELVTCCTCVNTAAGVAYLLFYCIGGVWMGWANNFKLGYVISEKEFTVAGLALYIGAELGLFAINIIKCNRKRKDEQERALCSTLQQQQHPGTVWTMEAPVFTRYAAAAPRYDHMAGGVDVNEQAVLIVLLLLDSLSWVGLMIVSFTLPSILLAVARIPIVIYVFYVSLRADDHH